MHSETFRRNLGATALRLTLGAMWVSHAWFKISAFGIAGFAGWLDNLGLPGFMAGPVIALELVGGALILVGIQARHVSLLLLPVLAVATWVHAPNGLIFSNANGGWEYPVFLMIASIVHVLIGDGYWALHSRPLASAVAQPAR